MGIQMESEGLLIDYRYCTGCHACEVACKKEHGMESDQFGIRVFKNGPFKTGKDTWQYDFVPIPTDMCDLCSGRAAKGKEPSCVVHCQSFAIPHGPIEKLAGIAAKSPKQAMFTVKAG